METKICIKCGSSERYKSAKRKVGSCKKCISIWREENKKILSDKSKIYRENNKESIKEKQKKYREDNREVLNMYLVNWRILNPLYDKKRDKAARKIRQAIHYIANKDKYIKYRKDNSEKRCEYNKQWKKNNPRKALEIQRKSRHIRRAKKMFVGGKLSKGLFDNLFKLQRGKCACCHVNLNKVKIHMDHIIPLFLDGANEDWNIQLLCQPCNQRKSRLHPIVFMQSRGFLL